MLAAPGMEVLTTVPREAYDFLSGSSLAAAHVTGVVALLLEHEPLLSPYEILELLRASVQPTSTPNGAAHPAIGIIDACAALTKLTGAPACP